MKVGTDGVLLGAWAGVRPTDRRMLDIGTGTGLIALMLAQRSAASTAGVRITGIDVEPVEQAAENGAGSPWADRLEFRQVPVQRFDPAEPFDLIVSNPPYFVDSLTCPDAGRTTARHAVSLPYGELCDAVVRLLAPEGRFAVILPVAEAEHFLEVCRGRLCLSRRTDVRTTPRRAPKRVLMEFRMPSAGGNPAVRYDEGAGTADSSPEASAVCQESRSMASERSELVVGMGAHEEYTPEYRALTRDFYLKF